MKKLLSNLYILGFMILTVFLGMIIWKLTFGHIVEEYRYRKNTAEIAQMKTKQKEKFAELTFEKAILDSEERVKHYLGYRVLEELRIKGHFHHIDFDFKPDQRSQCIGCHGDMPHDKVKELRAFGNMHASFISCQTCHIRFEGTNETGVYKWYDRTTGEIVGSPVMEGVHPGTYAAKIIPFEHANGRLQRVDTLERISFASEFRQKENTLTDLQKNKARKIIHKQISEKPHICEDCHQKEKPLLPLEDLGYPQKRVDAILSTEVVGMIKNYTQFYMPRILHPGFREKILSEVSPQNLKP